MANTRNAEALFSILGWDANAAFSLVIRDDVTAAETMEFAKALAACGVLVPSAMTDEEARRAAEDEKVADALDRSTAHSPDKFRAILEHIAKGEG